MYMVWHVDKYKITFKLVINHWTNEILYHIVVSSGQHLGLSFATHSRIFFSSEYFHYKTFIHDNCLENYNEKFQENLSRPGIIDASARYRAATRRLRNTALRHGVQPAALTVTCQAGRGLLQDNARVFCKIRLFMHKYHGYFVQ